jgi:hypothetical protein
MKALRNQILRVLLVTVIVLSLTQLTVFFFADPPCVTCGFASAKLVSPVRCVRGAIHLFTILDGGGSRIKIRGSWEANSRTAECFASTVEVRSLVALFTTEERKEKGTEE